MSKLNQRERIKKSMKIGSMLIGINVGYYGCLVIKFWLMLEIIYRGIYIVNLVEFLRKLVFNEIFITNY